MFTDIVVANMTCGPTEVQCNDGRCIPGIAANALFICKKSLALKRDLVTITDIFIPQLVGNATGKLTARTGQTKAPPFAVSTLVG